LPAASVLRNIRGMAETLINISADSVDDFMDKVSKAVGEGDGVMGETTYQITPKYTLSDGKVTKVTFELKVSIKRAHWSGGKPDDNNKKAILAAEDLNKKHEQKHLKLATDICTREFAKAQKALVGKSKDDVSDAVDAIKKLVDDAYDDLDAKEGMTDVTPNSNGSFTVKQVGV
jgi:predicted DNA-binding ArsR family transcriptional regulator